MIHIKIPATTANMGAGFDCFGMAFDLFNEICVEESDKFEIITDNASIPTSRDNLVCRAMEHFFAEVGKAMPVVRISQVDRIPLTRGLGSSAACVVGGLVAANALAGESVDTDEILRMACDMEGHPDNVAPALLGGLIVAAAEPKKVSYVKITPPDGVSFVALIPEFAVATKKSRGVLPSHYSREDVIFNISRASLFIASMMSGKWENLPTAVDDRIHQPYRKGLVPGMEDVFRKARDCGAFGVYLSGAGPTVMAIVPATQEDEFLKAMDGEWRARILRPNFNGAEVLER